MSELEFYRNRSLVVVVQIDHVSEIIPSNVGFHINTYFSVKMHYNIYPYNLRTGDHNCKSIVTYKISKCIRLEQVIVVIDHALRLKATELTWKHSSIHANVMDTFHTIANLLASNWKLFQYVECILIYVGMRDICLPGIIAERRITGVSYGRMYNRSVQSWRDGGNTSRS